MRTIIRHLVPAIVVCAIAALSAPEAVSQNRAEADTLRFGNSPITIIIEDGAVILRERGGSAAPRMEREFRLERRDRPAGVRMMHRDAQGSDTLVLDFERITRAAERAARHPMLSFERWFEDLDASPLGTRMAERAEINRMEAEARELARRAGEAEGEERDRLEAELRAHLDELFAEKLAVERERLDRRRERLEHDQQAFDERRRRRGEIIERRLRDLLGDRDVLEW